MRTSTLRPLFLPALLGAALAGPGCTVEEEPALDDDTASADDDSSPADDDAPARPMILGHRGTGSNEPGNPYPENTVASFLRALEEGADGVELDIQQTADGELVILHDELLDRTTTCSGCVIDLTLAELGNCQVRAHDSETGEEPIPTLDEVFDALPETAFVNIEIKGSDGTCLGPYASAEEHVVASAEMAMEVVARRGAEGRVQLSSFEIAAIRRVEEIDSALLTGYIWYTGDVDALVSDAVSAGVDAMNVHQYAIYEPVAQAIAEAGLDLWAWGTLTEFDVEAVLPWEPSAIITDAPDVVVAALASGT